jgi:hypothetical protein
MTCSTTTTSTPLEDYAFHFLCLCLAIKRPTIYNCKYEAFPRPAPKCSDTVFWMWAKSHLETEVRYISNSLRDTAARNFYACCICQCSVQRTESVLRRVIIAIAITRSKSQRPLQAFNKIRNTGFITRISSNFRCCQQQHGWFWKHGWKFNPYFRPSMLTHLPTAREW